LYRPSPMGKRTRRRSESRSDSEDTIRKAAKKYRRERKKDKGKDRDRDRDRDDREERGEKSKKRSRKEKRKTDDRLGGEDEKAGGGGGSEDKEKRKTKKADKRKAKKEEKERLLEERRQRLKLWKAKKGIKSEPEPAPAAEPPAEEHKAEPAAAKPPVDPIAAQLAKLKTMMALKRKAAAAAAAAAPAAPATSTPEAKATGDDTKAASSSGPAASATGATPGTATGDPPSEAAPAEAGAQEQQEETAAASAEGAEAEDGAAAAVEPMAVEEEGEGKAKAMAAPKLKKPKKWVPAVYELIGTEEFEGAPFMGTFVEDSDLKGKVYNQQGGSLFLYYWRPKRQWIIGDNYSSELGLVFVDTLARTPDNIARPWSFYDGQSGEWVATEDLVLRRLPTEEEAKAWAESREPERYEMKGPPEKFDGAPFMGVYSELIGYKPPVYQHESREFYLYFWKLKKQWIVGRDWKTDIGPVMFVESEAPTPDRVATYWNFWNPDTQEWDYDEDIWCPKAGRKLADEGAEEQEDAEAAAAAVTKLVEEQNKAADEAKSKAEAKKEEGADAKEDGEGADANAKEGGGGDGASMDVEKDGGGGEDEKEEAAGEAKDEKSAEDGAEKDKAKSAESDDPLEAFMMQLSGAKTDADKAAAVGLKKTRKAKVRGERIDISDEKDIDEKSLAKKAKEMLSWMERHKPKLKDLKPVDHSKMEYEPFRKNFYIESPEIAAMTPEEVKEMCKKELDNVRIRGKNVPKPIKKWTHCGLPKKIYRVLERLEYAKPFSIQATAIPAIMSGRDVIGIAKTGSGKTLAFLLPMFRQILDQRPLEKDEGPIAVILAPTRELAVQIHLEARKFAKPLQLRPVCVYGGASVAEQIAELKRGAEVITATPGRMIDLLCANSGRVTNLARVTYLVLDEADRMFDLGFEPQIMRVVQNVRPGRQTVMFSATFPRIVEKLAKVCMKQPIEIMIGGRSVATDNVTQFVEVREPETRFARLLEILGKWYSRGSILVFCNKKDEVDFLFQQLIDAGYPCFSVHGDMDQTDRDYAIMDFRKGLRTLMIATSIIARGLDVKDLVLVVNYDAPTHYEDYVHRIGRTGRAGKKGTAITFLREDEEQLALDLVTGLIKAKQVIPQDLQKLADEFKAKVARGEAKYYSNKGYDGRGHKFDEEEAMAQANEKRWERIGYGIEEKTDEDFLMEEQQRLEEQRKKAIEEVKKASLDPIKAQMAAAKKAAQAAMNAIKQKGQDKLATGHALLAAKVAVKNVMADAKIAAMPTTAAAKAAAVAAAIKASLRSAGPISGGEGGFFTDEIEINDYPQYARYKMTQRQVVVDIEERYECSITTKGTFIPAGRKPKDGERKLWLQIEGKTQVDVLRCKADIRRVLEEAASMRPDSNARRSGGGKYQVLSLTY